MVVKADIWHLKLVLEIKNSSEYFITNLFWKNWHFLIVVGQRWSRSSVQLLLSLSWGTRFPSLCGYHWPLLSLVSVIYSIVLPAALTISPQKILAVNAKLETTFTVSYSKKKKLVRRLTKCVEWPANPQHRGSTSFFLLM